MQDLPHETLLININIDGEVWWETNGFWSDSIYLYFQTNWNELKVMQSHSCNMMILSLGHTCWEAREVRCFDHDTK